MAQIKLNPHLSTSLSPGHALLALIGFLVALGIFAAKYTYLEVLMRSTLSDKVAMQIQRGNTRQEVRDSLKWLARPSALTTEILGLDEDVSENKLYRNEILLNSIEKLQVGEVRRAYDLSVEQLSAPLKQLYRSYFEKVEQLQDARSKALNLSREIQGADKEFELLAQDISELFASKQLVRHADDTLLKYQRGILKDMPAIKGIPDGLNELEDLKPYIKLILGNMDNDRTATFRENFERLREASQQNAREIADLRDSLDKENQRSLQLDSDLAGILKQITATIAAEIAGRSQNE